VYNGQISQPQLLMNVLILGHSFVSNLRRLCENPGKPHEWEDPVNARGKVSVQMHGYPGGRVKTLITAIEAGCDSIVLTADGIYTQICDYSKPKMTRR
jgi:hypothetical protein